MTQPVHIGVDDQLAGQDALLKQAEKQLEQTRKLAGEWKNLDEAYAREITKLIGKTKYENARPKHEELLARLRKSPELFNLSPEGQKAAETYRAQIIEERHELYRSLGFDHQAAIKLRRDFLERKAAAYDAYLGLGHEQEWVTLNPEGLPTIDTSWSGYSPPYAGAWGTAWTTGVGSSAWHSEDRTTGAINCWSYTHLVGTDDDDSGTTRAMSEVWVLFRVPVAGRVHVHANMQDVDTYMAGRLIDESGCSDGQVRQLSRAYVSFSGARSYLNICDNQVHSDGSDRTWYTPLTPTDYYPVPVDRFSSRVYAAGDFVRVAVGVQVDTSFHVNDMSVDPSQVTNRYLVKNIQVRSTGTP